MRQRYSDKVNKLLESKRPSLRILLEEDEDKSKEKKKKDSSKDMFSDLSLDNKKDSSSEEKEDMPDYSFDDESLESKKDEEKLDDELESQEDEEDISKKVDAEVEKEIEKRLKNSELVGDAKLPSKRDFVDILDKSLFGESFLRRSKLKDSFKLKEKRIFKIHKMLKENSMNSQLNELDISVDELVNNAINLTKNFTSKIDIPELIMDHIASRFAEKATEEEDESVANSYRVKLEEFIEKYLRKLVSIDDYKNYDASSYIIKNEPPFKSAIGARPTT